MPSPYTGYKYSEKHHKFHLGIARETKNKIVVCAARRAGKSFSLAQKLLNTLFQKMVAKNEAISDGKEKPWGGLNCKRAEDARRYQGDGVVKAVIVTASQSNYQEIANYLWEILTNTGCNTYLHPNQEMWRRDRGRETWFQIGKSAGVIKFRVSVQASQLVGGKADILWLDECGFIDNDTYNTLIPLIWEVGKDGIVWLSGTPSQGDDHFFSRAAMRGLPPKHPRANQSVVKHDPEWATFLATAFDAYSPNVRQEAAKEVLAYGKTASHIKKFVYGDWRSEGRLVFDEFHTDRHMIVLHGDARGYSVNLDGKRILFPRWDSSYLAHDWYRGEALGGLLAVYVWRKNPLNKDDPRPFVYITEEEVGNYSYTNDGWYKKMKRMSARHSPLHLMVDPFSPDLIAHAKRQIWNVKEGSSRKKEPRLSLISSLIHYNDEINLEPALMVSPSCKHMIRQLSNYKRAIDRQGNIKVETVQYDDSLIDALAYIVPEIMTAELTFRGGF